MRYDNTILFSALAMRLRVKRKKRKKRGKSKEERKEKKQSPSSPLLFNNFSPLSIL